MKKVKIFMVIGVNFPELLLTPAVLSLSFGPSD